MKRLLMLTVVALLALGLLGAAGCGKRVTREADVAAGDYYTEQEYKCLSADQREAYCASLADELEGLGQAATARTDEAGRNRARIDELRRELTRLQSQTGDAGRAEQLQEEIAYFEGLPTSYTVIRGDCLWNISGKEEIYADPIKWPRLYRANRDQISDPDLIYPGQIFSVPRDWPRKHRVVRGEWLCKIAGYWEIYDRPSQWTRLYEANRDQISDPDLIYPDQVLDVPR